MSAYTNLHPAHMLQLASNCHGTPTWDVHCNAEIVHTRTSMPNAAVVATSITSLLRCFCLKHEAMHLLKAGLQSCPCSCSEQREGRLQLPAGATEQHQEQQLMLRLQESWIRMGDIVDTDCCCLDANSTAGRWQLRACCRTSLASLLMPSDTAVTVLMPMDTLYTCFRHQAYLLLPCWAQRSFHSCRYTS